MIRYSLELTSDLTIHQFWGKVSNIYIIVDSREKKTYLVDCGLPSDVEAIVDVLQAMPPLKRIVCTHFHVDHVSAWIMLKRHFENSEIWFYERAKPFVEGHASIQCPSFNDYLKILIPVMKEYGYFPRFLDLFRGLLYGTPFKRGFPLDRVVFFGDNQNVLPGFRLVPTPGHRPDSVSFIDPVSGTFITGDFLIVINGEVMVNTYVSSRNDQQNSLKKIKDLKGIKFLFPGHGICRPFSEGYM